MHSIKFFLNNTNNYTDYSDSIREMRVSKLIHLWLKMGYILRQNICVAIFLKIIIFYSHSTSFVS